MVRVLISDRSRAVRAGLRSFLKSQGFDVVGEAPTGAAAVMLASLLAPDVVVIDDADAAVEIARTCRVIGFGWTAWPSDVVPFIDKSDIGALVEAIRRPTENRCTALTASTPATL
jgi:DNA-binding NarL/FixJ family response regulator